MSIAWRLMVLLAKNEVTYGVDPTLTGAANAILATDMTPPAMEGDSTSRNLILPYMGAQPSLLTGLRVPIQFSTELTGSGTPGVPPAWGVLARACGMAEVIEEDESVTYTPITEDHESAYLKYWHGNTLHALAGSRGTATLTIGAQGIPRIQWNLTGLFVDPVEAARAVPDFSAFQKPLVATKANTPVFTINGVAMVLRQLTFNFANDVQPDLLIGEEAIEIGDRAEQIQAGVRVVPLTTFDPFALAKTRTAVPLVITHGTVAGNIVTVSAPKCEIAPPPAAENQNGKVERTLSLTPLADEGNDQFSITLT